MHYIEDIITLLKKETFIREELINLLKKEIFMRKFVNFSVHCFFGHVGQEDYKKDLYFVVKNELFYRFKGKLNGNISERAIDSLLKPVYWGLVLGENPYILLEQGFDAVKNSISNPKYFFKDGLRDKLGENKGYKLFLDGIVKEILVKNKITFYARLNGYSS